MEYRAATSVNSKGFYWFWNQFTCQTYFIRFLVEGRHAESNRNVIYETSVPIFVHRA